jgi:hypothetical protein
MEHFPAFPPTTKLSCKVMVDCLREKPKFFQSKKNQKNQTFCVVSIIDIHPFGAFCSLSLLRRCLDFGLNFGHSVVSLYSSSLSFVDMCFFLYRLMKLLSLSLSFGWTICTFVTQQKFFIKNFIPTKSSFIRFRSNILGTIVRAGRQNINLFSCLQNK